MTPPSQTKLLVRPGFLALFVTQLLSAFNDNFLKNAVVIWIGATQAQLFGLSPEVMISLCSGVFIAPFFSAGMDETCESAQSTVAPCLCRPPQMYPLPSPTGSPLAGNVYQSCRFGPAAASIATITSLERFIPTFAGAPAHG